MTLTIRNHLTMTITTSTITNILIRIPIVIEFRIE